MKYLNISNFWISYYLMKKLNKKKEFNKKKNLFESLIL